MAVRVGNSTSAAEQGAAGQRSWEPELWGDLALFEPDPADAENAEAEDSDSDGASDPAPGKGEVVVESRPVGLRICSANQSGLGAIVTQSTGQVAAQGVEPGSAIISINARYVEDVPTVQIQNCLDDEPLPLTLGVKAPLNLQKAQKMKSRRRDPVTVCTIHCRGSYRAVQTALAQIGWREIPTETKEASVLWVEHSDSVEGVCPVQTVTRIEAFLHMCRKAPLARCLNLWMEELPDDFTFLPATWVLPYDIAELEATMSKGKATYIAKPSAGTQGKGIVLAKKWGDLADVVAKSKLCGDVSLNTEYVVQRYLAQPLLLDGLKFDMRIYVVVTSVVPLRAYLFKEGLARFCTVPYQPPKDGNLQEVCMHLTNYAVNKSSKDFQTSDGTANHDEGSKRSVSSVLWQIEQAHGVTAEEVWHKIAELSANTLMAIRPWLLEFYIKPQKRQRQLHPAAPKGFQIIGMDVLLGSTLQPHLLELNANPSLSVLQPGKAPASGSDTHAPMAAPSPVPMPSETPTQVLPAGSALKAARMTRDSVSENTLLAERSLDYGSADDDQFDVFQRIVAKLRNLQPQDLVSTEAYVDALLSGGAAGPAPRTTSPTRSATKPTPGKPAAKSASSQPESSEDRRKSASAQSKQRLGLTKPATRTAEEKPRSVKPMVTSQLDLEIKRELIAQALLVARPAPQSKVARLRKQYLSSDTVLNDIVPLDDSGEWIRTDIPADGRPEIRPDAPDRCPALEALDFEELVLPEVLEYAKAHLDLYRTWMRSCGPSQTTLGQAQMLKLLERRGFVGAGMLFPDKIAAQLWLTRIWRDVAEGAFGLEFSQFVHIAGRLGSLRRADEAAENDRLSISGVLEFVRRGGAGAD